MLVLLEADCFCCGFCDVVKPLLPCAGVGVHGEAEGAVAGEFLGFFGVGSVFKEEGDVGGAQAMEIYFSFGGIFWSICFY